MGESLGSTIKLLTGMNFKRAKISQITFRNRTLYFNEVRAYCISVTETQVQCFNTKEHHSFQTPQNDIAMALPLETLSLLQNISSSTSDYCIFVMVDT